ncbi:MCP four helix bundle domain-containing protein [Undibacterium sp. 14-3-2]|uniref:methyl-accepting chemotaxis protein n=1 Tax=Undibacterium sp. 14-3-2 TaxID=2800129 RepID=UPI001903AA4B|nr:methyl-accepting chemotaxis protein [Undibacterium sp. 14-3-2]MBK1888627.1 MCP four helix bundle domain-containing protein [Undibacterium sp. 14-3-2]
MSFFYDLKISVKLLISSLCLLLITIFIGIFSVTELAQVNTAARDLGENWMPSVKAAMGIKERVSRIRSQEAQMVFAENPEEVEKYVTRTKEAISGLREIEADYSRMMTNAAEKANYDEYAKLMADYLQITDKMIAAAKAGNQTEAVSLLRTTSSKVNTRLRDHVDKMVKIQSDGGIAAYEHSTQVYETARSLILVVLAICVVLGLALSFWIARLVSRPLMNAVKVAQTVASGDLTSHIEASSKDETGMLLQALKDMNDNLLKVVSEVRQGTDHITIAATEIAQGNLDLSGRTESQASSLEETASSMEEITSTIHHNADNARQANQLSDSASAVAQRGGDVVSQVVQTMGSINESSRKIVDIIGVIDGIAFQTNILALNAAVEAARAGEQGRGFAVVASEVRNLAQRSASAAKEIKELINDSVDKVAQGTRLVDQAGDTMSEVVASVRRVSDMINEITAAGHEQSAGIAQINDAITNMDTLTQQNAALVEEAAAAAAGLQGQAEKLSSVVSVFKLDQSQTAALNASAMLVNRNTADATKKTMAKPGKKETNSTAIKSAPVSVRQSPQRAAKAVEKAGDTAEWEEF